MTFFDVLNDMRATFELEIADFALITLIAPGIIFRRSSTGVFFHSLGVAFQETTHFGYLIDASRW